MTQGSRTEDVEEGGQDERAVGASAEITGDPRTRRLIRSLAERRKLLNLSQTEVAARMGTSQSALARLEAGEGDPLLSTIERYATAVDGEVLHGLRPAGTERRPLVLPVGLVDASDLEAWAPRLTAQTELGALVRRLIRASAFGVTRLHFPSAEGVQHGGWDGTAEVVFGNEHVPDGVSLWELGTGEDVKRKAEADFKKRSADPLGEGPSTSSFVFVTPRRWRWKPDKSAWEAQKKKIGPWRDVRLIDGDDLAAWLELAPPVHYWLSQQLGKFPTSATPLEGWWSSWARETSPALSPELLVAGRRKETEQLVAHLRAPHGVLSLQGDSSEEALAFIAAAIERLPDDERQAVYACGLVVRDEAGWRHAIASDRGLVLIPLFPGAAVTDEAAARHRVLVPLGREVAARAGTVELPQLSRAEAQDALRQMGEMQSSEDKRQRIDVADRAEDLSGVARRSLLSLRRRLAWSPALQQPAWASPDKAAVLVPAALAGSWNSAQDGDRQVLSQLSGRGYEELERDLVRWANESDPPIRRVGDVWYLSDREDAWSLLARYVTDDDLRRYEETVLAVLGVPLPATELPPEEQWQANLLGRESPNSPQLREGLVETLAVMGARTDQTQMAGRSTGQGVADRFARRLLEAGNTDESGRTWASLSGVLPLLAEAAPEVFLDAVETGLSGTQPIRHLFTDAPDRDPMFLHSPHTGLLWALECLAWSPQHLGRATIILGALSRLDPGGRLSNRPSGSLRQIYLPWYPQTSAPLATRFDVLTALSDREPEVGWQLLVGLLPQNHDVAMPTYAPRWREWKPSGEKSVTYEEVWRTATELVHRLLAKVGVDGKRWADLVSSVGTLSEALRGEVVDRLLSLDPAHVADEDRKIVSDAVRKVVSHHRRFPDADWAMPKAAVDRLAETQARFQLDDPVARSVWLFTSHPELPDAQEDRHDWRAFQGVVDDSREAAVRDIYVARGFDGILELGAIVEQPGELGRVLGQRKVLDQSEENQVLAQLAHEDERRQAISRGYVHGSFWPDHWDWANPLLEANADLWGPPVAAGFLVSVANSRRTWEWVERLGPSVERAYWEQVLTWVDDGEDHSYAVEKLLQYGRPHHAVDLLARQLHGGTEGMNADLVMRSLEAAARTSPGPRFDGGMFGYYVEQLLDFVEVADGADPSRIAGLELAYLRLLRHGQRPPRLLHGELTRDPAFFAEVVSWIFKPEGGDPREVTDELRLRAQLGYELLGSWKQIPGLGEGGSINAESLEAWVVAAREKCAELDRRTMGDQHIGRILRYAPEVAGMWPPEEVSNLIEKLASRQIERGLEIEVYNSRGTTTRSLTEGGGQERVLADRYRTWAAKASGRLSRTAAMLQRIAKSYESDAEREDLETRLREDKGW